MISPLGVVCWALAAASVWAGDDCTENVSISSQADADAIKDCESLTGELSISSSASGTITLDELKKLKGGLTVQDTTALNGIKLSDLESVSGRVLIENNEALTSLDVGELSSVGGELKIEDNAVLKSVDLGDLKTINGGLVLGGVFDRLVLDKLDRVHGTTDISSSGNISCETLEALNSDSNSVFQGSFSCSTTSSSDGLSPGAKAGIAIGVIAGVILIVLLIWFCVRRQRRQRQIQRDHIAATTAGKGDEEKGDRRNSPSPSPSPDSPSPPAEETVNVIPRKPLSPPPPAAMPASLVAGDRSSGGLARADSEALFLRAMPRRHPPAPPSESDVPMLDSGNVHEAPPQGQTGREGRDGLFELEGGPVRGTHQQAIHHEGS